MIVEMRYREHTRARKLAPYTICWRTSSPICSRTKVSIIAFSRDISLFTWKRGATSIYNSTGIAPLLSLDQGCLDLTYLDAIYLNQQLRHHVIQLPGTILSLLPVVGKKLSDWAWLGER